MTNAVVLAPIFPVLFKHGWSLITRTTIPAVVTVPFSSDTVPPSNGRATGFGEIGLEVLGHKAPFAWFETLAHSPHDALGNIGGRDWSGCRDRLVRYGQRAQLL